MYTHTHTHKHTYVCIIKRIHINIYAKNRLQFENEKIRTQLYILTYKKNNAILALLLL